MPSERNQFKSSYGAFTARELELERSRARRDAREAAADAASTRERPTTTPQCPLV
jgi:hypothetical protein